MTNIYHDNNSNRDIETLISYLYSALGRVPSRNEIRYWYELISKESLSAFIAFINTPEALTALNPNERFESIETGVKVLFDSTLNRLPDQNELKFWTTFFGGQPGNALKAFMSTPEVTTAINSNEMSLKNVKNLVINRADEQSWFFLHIPKTGGSSFRASYSMSNDPILGIHESDTRTSHIWNLARALPVSSGHLSITHVPDDFQVFSLIREPRSRMVSLWHYLTSAPVISRIPRRDLSEYCLSIRHLSLGDWLLKSIGDAMPNFAMLKPLSYFFGFSELDKDYASDMESSQLLRVSSLFWLEANGVKQALDLVKPTRQQKSEPRVYTVNQGENIGSTLTKAQREITTQDLSILNHFAESDRKMIDLAIKNRLLLPRDESTLDDDFRATLMRLNLSLI